MNKKELLILSIGVFLTVIAWLIADIYHAATEEIIQAKVASPRIINYTIDKDIIKAIESKTE